MDLKEKLLDILHTARAREQAFVEALSPAERAAEGSPDDWSPKDLVAHMADWRLQKAGDLASLARGVEPPDSPELDAANQIIYRRHRAKPWNEILKFSADSWAALETALHRLTEDLLAAPSSKPSMQGRPNWRMVTVDVAIHPVTHLASYLVRHGRLDDATRWEEENAAGLEGLDPSPSWHGTIRYNLACHYALRGQGLKAVATLSEALRLNPDLTEWSKQDSDLDSLRGEPAYRALYEDSDQ
jgi:tetratricopeptide (TPR) repeat protein